jgi:hypothetical protein
MICLLTVGLWSRTITGCIFGQTSCINNLNNLIIIIINNNNNNTNNTNNTNGIIINANGHRQSRCEHQIASVILCSPLIDNLVFDTTHPLNPFLYPRARVRDPGACLSEARFGPMCVRECEDGKNANAMIWHSLNLCGRHVNINQ